MDGRNGDAADDHYHRYMGDVEIMQSLGVNAYRFSISWARILPRGRLGGVNPDGIAFYNRLIDALLQKGIQPFVTLHHFDMPHELEVRYVGWLGAGIREEFEHYADVCFRAFGDRVRFWTTFNEPNLFTKFMYMLGMYPPNHCSPPFGSCNSGNSNREPYAAAHNIIMSHAAAVRTYKEKYQVSVRPGNLVLCQSLFISRSFASCYCFCVCDLLFQTTFSGWGGNADTFALKHFLMHVCVMKAKQGGSIGIVIAMKWYEPLTNTTEDILAARRAQSFELEWFLDPIFFGDYPTQMREILKSNLPTFTSEEKKLLQYKSDFIGLNHYTAIYTKDCIHSPCDLRTYEGNALVSATGERDGVKIGGDTALAGYYVVPEAVEPAIMYVNQRYKDTPVYITENGYSQWSDISREELINDVERLNYLRGYVTHLSKAIRNGANVRGYFVWTLLDNFEWTFGYRVRFGLYHVDFDTQERTPRMSARWYRSFLTGSASAALTADEAAAAQQERRADS
ncbi:hypothetical protein PVAP13_7KG241000 [Panicum virgatum]|uniref:4-hydroxy-7-methoxy-3-oxo-3,4-dihydro-2H-1,4-benzoxazin-2-yl glucosidebeta-D-glucosidase n=1 Tax=Panicum virgatum TaxID=38727 RepID=A0A8T0QE11_PANVG|nr:hypothetical protein PVAP13_7KG241000 [Panicum virgatum]